MNTANFVGRVGQDPQPLGQSGLRFSIAVDGYNPSSKQRETTWVPLVVFGKQADFVRQYIAKGRLVSVTARYATREYEANGEKRKDHNFVVDRIEPVGPPPQQKKQQDTDADPESGGLW